MALIFQVAKVIQLKPYLATTVMVVTITKICIWAEVKYERLKADAIGATVLVQSKGR